MGDTFNKEDFAKRIKAVREKLNMTQKEIADAIGFSSSFISDIESGRSKVGVDFLYALAKKCNINLYFLLFGEGDIINTNHPSLGNKKIGQSIETVAELLWYIEHSTMIRQTVLSSTSLFILKNRQYVIKEIEKQEENSK